MTSKFYTFRRELAELCLEHKVALHENDCYFELQVWDLEIPMQSCAMYELLPIMGDYTRKDDESLL